MPSKQQPSIFQGGTPKFIKRRQDYTNIQRPKASLSPTNIGNNFNSFNSFKVYGTNENNNNGSARRKNQQMNQRNESFVVSPPSKKSPQFFSTFARNESNRKNKGDNNNNNDNNNKNDKTKSARKPKFNMSTRKSKMTIKDISPRNSSDIGGKKQNNYSLYYSSDVASLKNKPPSPTGIPPAGTKRVIFHNESDYYNNNSNNNNSNSSVTAGASNKYNEDVIDLDQKNQQQPEQYKFFSRRENMLSIQKEQMDKMGGNGQKNTNGYRHHHPNHKAPEYHDINDSGGNASQQQQQQQSFMVEQLPKSIQQCHEEIIALREAYNTMLMDDMTSTEQGIDRLNIMPSASNFLSNNNVNKNNNSGNIKRNGRPSSNSIDDNLNIKLSSTQRQLGELKKRNKKLKEERDDYMKMAKELGGKDKKKNLNLKLEQMTAKYQKMCSVKNLEISKLRSDNTRLKKVMTNLRLETEEQVQRALAQARMHKQKASQAASSQVRGSSGSSGKRHRGRQRTRSPPKSRKKKHNNADAIATHSDAINNNNNNNSPQYTMMPGEQVRNDPIKASLQKQKMKIISNGENPMKSGTPHYMMSLEHSNQNHLAIQQQERHDEIYNAERHHTNAAHHPNQQNQLYHQHQQHHQQQIQHNINNFNNADSTVTHAEHNVPPLPSDVNYPKGHELLKKSTSVADVMKTYNMNYDDLLLNNHHNIMHNPDEPRDMSQSRQDESPSPPPLLGNSGNAYDKYNIHVATESYSNFRARRLGNSPPMRLSMNSNRKKVETQTYIDVYDPNTTSQYAAKIRTASDVRRERGANALLREQDSKVKDYVNNDVRNKLGFTSMNNNSNSLSPRSNRARLLKINVNFADDNKDISNNEIGDINSNTIGIVKKSSSSSKPKRKPPPVPMDTGISNNSTGLPFKVNWKE